MSACRCDDHDCGQGESCAKCRCHGDAFERAAGRPDPAANMRQRFGNARSCSVHKAWLAGRMRNL